MKKEETIAGKVFEYMEQHRMLERGDKVVAGISGGADSVCLLFLSCQYRKKIPFDIRVNILGRINHHFFNHGTSRKIYARRTGIGKTGGRS